MKEIVFTIAVFATVLIAMGMFYSIEMRNADREDRRQAMNGGSIWDNRHHRSKPECVTACERACSIQFDAGMAVP